MGNLTVAIIAPQGYAAGIGKKSGTSDITSYDNKKGEVTVSIIEPTSYPEKLASLFYSASMADIALVVVEKIDAAFGECALMLDCAGVRKGYIVLRGGVVREQIAPLIKGLTIENYFTIEDNPVAIRERLMDDASNLESNEPLKMTTNAGSVPVDQSFNVKGVGTVVLGNVVEGVMKRHDRVKVLPGGKSGEVRSIQKHDDEFDWSARGDRVGLALKGLEVADVERGMVLTNNPSLKSDLSITAELNVVKYWPKPLEEGMVLHTGHWMQFLPSRLESVKDDGDWRHPTVKLAFDKPVVHLPEDKAVLCYLDGGKLRVIGSFLLP